MNLLDFKSKIISSDSDKKAENDTFFSEEVTMFNILNGYFLNKDILSITEDFDKRDFSVDISSEEIATFAEQNLDQQITPGAYCPLYRVNVSRKGKKLNFKLNQIM